MKLLAWLLDLLYPPKCVICGKLLEKRGGVRDEKTYAFLRRYGHTPSDIRAAYAAYEADETEEHDEENRKG